MKYRALIIIISLSLFLCSCSAIASPPSGMLDYQEPPFNCLIAYEKAGFSGECELIRADGDKLLLTYVLPETLAGISFSVGESVEMRVESVAVPLSGALSDAEIIAAAFSLDSERLKSYSADAQAGICVAIYETDLGDAAVTFENKSGDVREISLCGIKITINR